MSDDPLVHEMQEAVTEIVPSPASGHVSSVFETFVIDMVQSSFSIVPVAVALEMVALLGGFRLL